MRMRMTVALTMAIVVGLACGCEAPEHAVSRYMADGYLQFFGARGGFAEVSDWRQLMHPSDAMRSRFALENATYRVLSARRDQAELVVWQTGQAGPEPFNANVEATGHGCVVLRRTGATTVRTRIRTCPPRLGPPADSEQASWGRDSNARATAENVLAAMYSNVTWLMHKETNGYPRHSARTRAQILAAIRSTTIDKGQSITVDVAPRQPAGQFRATVTARATAADPTDTRRTVRARACSSMTVHFADPNYDMAMDGSRPAPCR